MFICLYLLLNTDLDKWFFFFFLPVWLAKRSAPGSIPLAPAQKITKPASKYGVPLTVRKVSDAAKKPAERKPAVKHKPAPLPGAPKRRVRQMEEERKKHEVKLRAPHNLNLLWGFPPFFLPIYSHMRVPSYQHVLVFPPHHYDWSKYTPIFHSRHLDCLM